MYFVLTHKTVPETVKLLNIKLLILLALSTITSCENVTAAILEMHFQDSKPLHFLDIEKIKR